jgi:hypothetical protein
LFGAILVAWVAKLEIHPAAATTVAALLDRAAIATIPGWLVALAVAMFAAGGTVLAIRAPSERMINWTTVPSPVDRLLARSRGWIPDWASPDDRDARG